MTKEELKQEAEESFEQYKVTDEDYVVSPYSDDMGEKMLMYNDEYYAEETYLRLYKQGYLASAEPREKSIEELEEKLANADYQLEGRDLEIKELKEELKKWKDEWQEQVQKATDEGYARTLQTIQLSKAKDIIREVVEWATWQGSNCPNFKSIQDKAEAFLNSEVEK